MGRTPQPTALKMLRGNPGHRKLDTLHEPQVVVGLGEPPPELTGDAEAIKLWMGLGPELVKMGTLGLSDRNLFASYCQAVSENLWLSPLINALKAKKSRSGKQAIELATYISQRRKAQAMSATLGAQFGVGAANRTRIKVQHDDGQTTLPGMDPEPDSPLKRAMAAARSA